MNAPDPAVAARIEAALAERFGRRVSADPSLAGLEDLAHIAEHRSHRKYLERAVAPELLELLFACALCAPSKSDLQQADIVHVADRAKVDAITALIPDMPWIAK